MQERGTASAKVFSNVKGRVAMDSFFSVFSGVGSLAWPAREISQRASPRTSDGPRCCSLVLQLKV